MTGAILQYEGIDSTAEDGIVMLDEGNHRTRRLLSNGGGVPSESFTKLAAKVEQKRVQKELDEKSFLNEWDQIHPSKMALGIPQAEKAYIKYENLETLRKNDEEAYDSLAAETATQNEALDAQIEVFQAEEAEARSNTTAHPLVPSNDQLRWMKMRDQASEAKAKYNIAFRKRQEAEANYQVALLLPPEAKVAYKAAQTKVVYSVQAARAGRAINAARVAKVDALEQLVENQKDEYVGEEKILENMQLEWKRLDKIVSSQAPQPCAVLDFLARQLIRNLALGEGFQTAEARCHAVKESETRACGVAGPSGWMKAITDQREEQWKVETQMTNVSVAKGTLNAYQEALMNATQSRLKAMPLMTALNLEASDAALKAEQAKTKLLEAGPTVAAKEAKVKSEQQNQDVENTLATSLSAQELTLEVRAKAYVQEMAEKAQEKADKAEIKSKYEEAEMDWKAVMLQKNRVYADARDNVTALVAVSQNKADLYAAAMTAFIADPTESNRADAQSGEYAASHAGNATIAAEEISDERKEKVDAEKALEPAAPTNTSDLDGAVDFRLDNRYGNKEDISRASADETELFEHKQENIVALDSTRVEELQEHMELLAEE